MLTRLRERSASESGFTLVELLVVMLILGILAAIAIPSFFNQRDKARDADAKAAVRTAQTAMETYRTDSGGDYLPTPSVAQLVNIEETLGGADLQAPVSTADTYTVRVDSDTGNWFSISRTNTGATTFDCETEENAGCPLGGNWAD
jgi:type IV pilus assembly protein PilA